MLYDTKDVQILQVKFYKSLYATQFFNAKEKKMAFWITQIKHQMTVKVPTWIPT